MDAQERAKIMAALTAEIKPGMIAIYSRWMDEKGNENFSEYETAMRRFLGDAMPGAVFYSASRRPFGFDCGIPDFPYNVRITISAKNYGWKSVPLKSGWDCVHKFLRATA